ncbi:MAG: hypothetical protein ACKVX9_00265 [Blastocatellia bacterium]
MPLVYANLDDATRSRMLEEINLYIAAGRLYLSGWLTPAGQAAYSDFLRRAAEWHDDGWLAAEILTGGWLAADAEAEAAQMLAEGEFNRFYMRARCRRAIDEGKKLEVYRAKSPETPRAGLESHVGQVVEPEDLLGRPREGGRSSPLLKPGAGLSVRPA